MQRLVAAVLGAGVCVGASAASAAARHGILFVPSLGKPQIYVWQGESRPERVSRSPQTMDWPQWAPGGEQIAFAGLREIYTMRADGTGVTQVTHDAQGGDVVRAIAPSWSPDGRQIVFVRQFGNRPRSGLAVVAVAGGRERALRAAGDHPAWGRSGIAYAGARGIMLLNPRTGSSTVFAPLRRRVVALAWSPDGPLVALEGELGQQIVVYSAAGRVIRRFGLPSPAVGTCGVAWSRDGSRLLAQVEEYGVLRRRLPRAQRPPRGAYTGLWTVSRTGHRWRRLPIDAKTCTMSWR